MTRSFIVIIKRQNFKNTETFGMVEGAMVPLGRNACHFQYFGVSPAKPFSNRLGIKLLNFLIGCFAVVFFIEVS